MPKSSKRDKTREQASIVAAKNRRELIAAGFSRRDLLKMGLLTGAGMLVPKIGLSARPLSSAGFLDDTPQSRPTRPFIEEMPIGFAQKVVKTLICSLCGLCVPLRSLRFKRLFNTEVAEGRRDRGEG